MLAGGTASLHVTTVLAALSEGVVIIDGDGVVQAVNAAGEVILGASEQQMRGNPLLALPWRAFEEDGRPLDRGTHPIMAALTMGLPQPERLLRYPRKDGTECWIATAARPLLGDDGRIEGAVSSFRDVTQARSAEQRLRASERHYRALFEVNATVQLIVGARDGIIRAANPAAVSFYGYSETELAGMSVSALSRLDASTVSATSESVLSGNLGTFRRRQFTKDGSPREVEVFANPIVLGDELVLHAIIIDVTATIEAREGLRRLAAILDQTPDVVGMFDTEGRLFYANGAGRAMLGAPPQVQPTFMEAARYAAAHGLWRGETTLGAERGTARVMDQVVIAHRDDAGELTHFSTILRDVTEMREVQLQLRDQAHELEVQTEELMQQSDELTTARQAADQANHAKSQFLAQMSHELRTPLTAIIGFSNVLRANRGGGMSEQEIVFASRVADNAIRLLGLIDQVLDLSKVEAGHMIFERAPVDVSALARDVIEDLQGRDREPGVALRAEVPEHPAYVQGDSAKLRQVLVNLIGNAVKFTSEGEIVVRVTAQGDRALRIDVQDSGIGIAPDQQAAVFAPFSQEDNTISRRYGGTGLGLAISREYCLRMGYSLTLASAPGEGSTFTVEFA